MALHAVIMAGGKGERLWPLSQPDMPKQLLAFDESGSLLKKTVERIEPIVPHERIYVVTNREIAVKVHRELPQIPVENILVEPVGRNTAPCIGFAAAVISCKDPAGSMAVFPADHMIDDKQQFTQAVSFGFKSLEIYPEFLITLGCIPDRPETGYGYIAPGEVILKDDSNSLQQVTSFHEKPQLNIAHRYISSGYLWNSGMFVWRVDTILQTFARHLPDTYKELMRLSRTDARDLSAIEHFYNEVQAISIDYGIMEKAVNVAVIPVAFGWSDIGSWDAAGKLLVQKGHGNSGKGKVVCEDSSNNVVWASKKNVVLLGVDDLVVVEGRDAILVCARNRAQDVSRIAKKMQT